jgi:HK97 family phage prohead protease
MNQPQLSIIIVAACWGAIAVAAVVAMIRTRRRYERQLWALRAAAGVFAGKLKSLGLEFRASGAVVVNRELRAGTYTPRCDGGQSPAPAADKEPPPAAQLKSQACPPLGSLSGAAADRDEDFARTRFTLKSFDGAGGQFTGYAAVWDVVDPEGDVFDRGAFADAIATWQARGTLPRIKWRHMELIGHVTELAEDDKGLLVAGRIWDQAVAAEIANAVAEAKGDPQAVQVGMSLMFYTTPGGDYMKDGARHLRKVELGDDVTITLRPVNSAATIVEFKSGDVPPVSQPSIKLLEAGLRDAGCSRRQAKTVLSRGYSGLCDAGTELAAGLAAIARQLRSI